MYVTSMITQKIKANPEVEIEGIKYPKKYSVASTSSINFGMDVTDNYIQDVFDKQKAVIKAKSDYPEYVETTIVADDDMMLVIVFKLADGSSVQYTTYLSKSVIFI